ncbi:MAG: endonuclease III [Thermoplasmata archaeon]
MKGLKAKAMKVDSILTRTYGFKELTLDEDPLDTLIETILSQNTTDVNSRKAFRRLKAAYPRWEDLMGEDPAKVARIIQVGGLAEIKAARILDALEFIHRERGTLDLSFLRSKTREEVDAWLSRMKGVGPKTRGIVMLFSLGLPAFPVDTHIHRVSKRLGLIGPNVSREAAQEKLAKLVPPGSFYNFHINLIEHGRAVCRARRPMCDACELNALCDYFRRTSRAHT